MLIIQLSNLSRIWRPRQRVHRHRVLRQRRPQHPRPRPYLHRAVLPAGDDPSPIVAPPAGEAGAAVGVHRLLRPPVLAYQEELALGGGQEVELGGGGARLTAAFAWVGNRLA